MGINAPIGHRRRDFLAVAGAALLVRGAQAQDNARPDFARWLTEFRGEAAGQGISQVTLDRALSGLAPIDRILQLDRAQPERKVAFDDYMKRAVNGERVRVGRLRLRDNAAVLEAVRTAYGVEPRFVVALWGMETDYGGFTGGYSVVGALATLAYDGRRTFFRRELVQALRIIDQGHVNPAEMVGSWAGAMGQAQFMPSSFLAYAVDHDRDGRKDIWRSTADVLASIANYLRRVGWRAEEGWGQPIVLPPSLPAELTLLDVVKPMDEWRRLGLAAVAGTSLPPATALASVVRPGGAKGPAYLVTENYRVFMRWNKSLYFATATGTLADRIGAA